MILAALRVPLAVTWLTVAANRINGVKLFPLGVIIVKSEGPHTTGEDTPSHQVSCGQMTSQSRILDIHRDDFQRRFHLCPPQVLNRRSEGAIWRRFC